MPSQLWLPNPPDGTAICLGFDGSINNDFTAIGAETMDGYSFTPRITSDEIPSVWNPAEHGGRIPHLEVEAAVDELFERFDVVRMYCDPEDWDTDIENWALQHGEEHVAVWETNRAKQMYEELRRFEADLREGRIRHDGCPTAAEHISNARKNARPAQRYILGKPNENQKIDVAMTRVLAHTAKADAVAAGWEPRKPRSKVRVWR